MRTQLLFLCLAVCASAVSQQSQPQSRSRLDQALGQTEPNPGLDIHGLGELNNQLASDDLLKYAQRASDRAKQDETRGDVFDAASQYEDLLQYIQHDPGNRDTTAIHLMKAAAYVDAARTRFHFGQQQRSNAAVFEDNMEKATHYLASSKDEIEASTSMRLVKSIDILGWRCTTFKLDAQTIFLKGMINNNPPDLGTAVKYYRAVGQCDANAKGQVDSVVSYITGVQKAMSKSPLSGDAIVKDIQDVLKLGGWKGDFVSLVVEKVWDYKKTHAKAPDINVH